MMLHSLVNFYLLALRYKIIETQKLGISQILNCMIYKEYELRKIL